VVRTAPGSACATVRTRQQGRSCVKVYRDVLGGGGGARFPSESEASRPALRSWARSRRWRTRAPHPPCRRRRPGPEGGPEVYGAALSRRREGRGRLAWHP
jgi:hypothetical protein